MSVPAELQLKLHSKWQERLGQRFARESPEAREELRKAQQPAEGKAEPVDGHSESAPQLEGLRSLVLLVAQHPADPAGVATSAGAARSAAAVV